MLACDQNYDLLKCEKHKPTNNFLSFLLSNEFVPYISKPTRVTHNTCTLIDGIYVHAKNKAIAKSKSVVIVDGMSDHYPCFLSYTMKTERIPNKSKEIVFEKKKI